jgi:YgiT-type zinc finger domain-containing protein
MAATLSRCFRCGSSAIETRDVEELVRRGPYVAALRLRADVCTACGERYLDGDDVATIESVRQRLERGELEGFRVAGELLEPTAG